MNNETQNPFSNYYDIRGIQSPLTQPLFHDAEVVDKAWGREIVIANNPFFCGKILAFNPNAKFSMHFHMKKRESWYVHSGKFTMVYIDTTTATKFSRELKRGDVIDINIGVPHQLIAGDEFGEIFEVSTIHNDVDSYRVEKGDSQNK